MTAHERSPYEEICDYDLVTPVAHLINQGTWELTDDGRIRVPGRRTADHCWMQFHPRSDRACLRWNAVYHRYYRLVPKACRHCWKVVHKVQNVTELFRLAEIMEGMGLEAKCGVDDRMSFGGLNQCVGFWYAPLHGGLKAGRNLFKQVKEHLTAVYKMEPESLILKRGCTEMEAMIPSSEWDEFSEAFDAQEQRLDATYDIAEQPTNELPLLRPRIHRRWLERRAGMGDPTVALYGLRPFAVVQYQNSEHNELDFPGLGQATFCKGVDDE